ncbi:DUF6385 domain-containing protein [Bacillus sp. CGMCC 1.16541]|uniref:DUF6385 domain-containing protein n=1 Tax=Bacillus sp. CGMCC 1.16541 TaxID=2185143 RepID=UPI000D73AE6E|nr:DUF6385 domain-containing protein [Bacillus sp. CGMCC 1.16541]
MKRDDQTKPSKPLLTTIPTLSSTRKNPSDALPVSNQKKYDWIKLTRVPLLHAETESGEKVPLQVNKFKRLKISAVQFVNEKTTIHLTRKPKESCSYNVSEFQTYTLAVVNHSCEPIDVVLQLSPNNRDFYTEGPTYRIYPDAVELIVPQRFTKFVRLRLSACHPPASATIYLQAQMY